MASDPKSKPSGKKHEGEGQHCESNKILARIHELKTLLANEKPTNETKKPNDTLEYKRNRRPQWVTAGITLAYCVFAGAQWLALKEANRNVWLEQRAWVYANFQTGEVALNNGEPVFVTYTLVNGGRTVARNVKGNVKVEILDKNQTPNFDYDTSKYNSFYFEMGALFPNGSINLRPLYWVSPDAINKKDPRTSPLSPAWHMEIEAGDKYIVTYGKFTYDDASGGSHWITFCTASHGIDTKACAQYNNTDTE